jgi:hypothetical protein
MRFASSFPPPPCRLAVSNCWASSSLPVQDFRPNSPRGSADPDFGLRVTPARDLTYILCRPAWHGPVSSSCTAPGRGLIPRTRHHLTPTEFELLALLMRNRGAPVTHTKLLSAVWGPEYSSEVEYLRSYVNTLRKKIEDDAARPKYILTCLGLATGSPIPLTNSRRHKTPALLIPTPPR